MSPEKQKKEEEIDNDEKFFKKFFITGTIFLSLILLFILYLYSVKLNNENIYNLTNTINITNMINITNTTDNSKEDDFLVYYVMFGFFGYGTCICSCVAFVLNCLPDKQNENKSIQV